VFGFPPLVDDLPVRADDEAAIEKIAGEVRIELQGMCLNVYPVLLGLFGQDIRLLAGDCDADVDWIAFFIPPGSGHASPILQVVFAERDELHLLTELPLEEEGAPVDQRNASLHVLHHLVPLRADLYLVLNTYRDEWLDHARLLIATTYRIML
jgi:hypothetical protein